MKRVLVGCEFSGRARDAFTARGFHAVSCDLRPTETPGEHYQGDVRDLLHEPWDLGVFFPDCTHLTRSGARWWPEKQADGRQQAAMDFFMLFTEVDYPSAIENPPGIMSTAYRKPDQIIHPYQFGDEAQKQTGLWLKELPLLQPTNVVGKGEMHVTKSGKRMPKWYNLPPGPERERIRSRTWPGIADAMADQWGRVI